MTRPEPPPTRTRFASRLASGFLHYAGGTAAARLFGFATGVVLARTLGAAEYGLFGIVRSTLSMFAAGSALGLGSTAARELPRRPAASSDRSRLIGLCLGIGSLAAVVSAGALIALSAPLARDLYREAELGPLFRWGAIWLLALALGNLLRDLLLGLEAFREVSRVMVASAALLLPAVGAALWMSGASPRSAVAAFAAVALVEVALLAGHLRGRGVELRPTRAGATAERRTLVRYTLPAYLFILLQAPVSWLVLTRLAMVESGATYVGAVTAVGSLRSLLGLLPGALAVTLLPLLSSVHGCEGDDRFRSALRGTLRLLWFGAVPVGVGLGGALPALMTLAFGAEYAAFAAPCALLIVTTMWSIPNEALDRGLAAVGRMWTSLGFGLFFVCLCVGGTFLLVPAHGLWGYAVAQAASFAVYVVLQQVYTGRLVGFDARTQWGTIGFGVLGGVVGLLIATIERPLPSLLGGAGAGFLFAFIAWRLLDPQERGLVQRAVPAVPRRFEPGRAP